MESPAGTGFPTSGAILGLRRARPQTRVFEDETLLVDLELRRVPGADILETVPAKGPPRISLVDRFDAEPGEADPSDPDRSRLTDLQVEPPDRDRVCRGGGLQ